MEHNKQQELYRLIADTFTHILPDSIIGIYVHGSAALGDFSWERSDLDLIVIIDRVLSIDEREVLWYAIRKLSLVGPPKGIEISFVLSHYAKRFIYPTPYEFHYSPHYRNYSLSQFLALPPGSDFDLAVHFTIVIAKGIKLYGAKARSVFGDISMHDYSDSIMRDLDEAQANLDHDPCSTILNLCRTLALFSEHLLLSKKQGGRWALKNLPHAYHPIIKLALQDSTEFSMTSLSEFINYSNDRLKRDSIRL